MAARLATALLLLFASACSAQQTSRSPSPSQQWWSPSVAAPVKTFLHQIFSDNCVLPRQSNTSGTPIYGWTDGRAAVTVTISELRYTLSTQAAPDGFWRVEFWGLKAGGPYTLSAASGSRTVALRNVMVGDVWLLAGQSNAAFTFQSIATTATVWRDLVRDTMATVGNTSNLRLLTLEPQTPYSPQATFASSQPGWQVSSVNTADNSSAIASLFGWNLTQTLKVPIGIVVATAVGSCINEWTSFEWLRGQPTGYQSSRACPAAVPAGRYNGLIAPLTGLPMAGVIWYQGESEANLGPSPQVYDYEESLEALLGSWREGLDQPDLPFLVVQLHNANVRRPVWEEPVQLSSAWALVREAQMLVALSDESAELVVTADTNPLVGRNLSELHSPNKWTVAARLAAAALRRVYGSSTVAPPPPVFQSMQVTSWGAAIITFDSAGPLVTGRIDGTKWGIDYASNAATTTTIGIAGSDRSKWLPASVNLSGNSLTIWNPDVRVPSAVRYCWADNPLCNLYTAAGVPVVPFRTDGDTNVAIASVP